MTPATPPASASENAYSAPDLPALGLRPLHPSDLPQIEKLDERAFGPGRFARTAYRLREGVKPDYALSFVAHVGTLLVGSNIMTPVACGRSDGAAVDMMLLGPLTVEPAFRSRGIGEALAMRSLDAARAAGQKLVDAGRRRALLRPPRLQARAARPPRRCRARSIPPAC